MLENYGLIFGAFSILVVLLSFAGNYAAAKIGARKDIDRTIKDIDSHEKNISEIYGILDEVREHKRTEGDCNRMMDKMEEQSNFRDDELKQDIQKIESTMNSNTRELKLSITNIDEKLDKRFDIVIQEIKRNGNRE